MKRSLNKPHKRRPDTSERVHPNPSTGRLGFSADGLPTGPFSPSQSRTMAISPKGTPVWTMPKGPGIHAHEDDPLRPVPIALQIGPMNRPRVVERIVDMADRGRETEPADVSDSRRAASINAVACEEVFIVTGPKVRNRWRLKVRLVVASRRSRWLLHAMARP
jgi:hypothetical protein